MREAVFFSVLIMIETGTITSRSMTRILREEAHAD